ncbi:MAG TPA: Hsp20/alpha crystallin family protein [Kiritimatiellia bacterium]|nr:Hsp20/alpha crystallin family protein [Kiritimatiellia bacterium]HMP34184.1 Hsp20/alpha crystallin family protein [Kiritimatiellia bacterium]
MVKNLIPWKRKKHEVEVLKPHDDPTYHLSRSMADLVHELFRPFDEAWSGSLLHPARAAWSRLPSIDVVESDDAVTVTADLPGLEEKDVEVVLDDHTLTLKGERREERTAKNGNVHRVERTFGSFYRSIPLPEGIDRDRVEATFKRGVLRVHLAKRPDARPSTRRIPVKAA